MTTRGTRRLSRRRVKEIVAFRQQWSDADGNVWAVARISRQDGLVRLERRGAASREVTFGELGNGYELVTDA